MTFDDSPLGMRSLGSIFPFALCICDFLQAVIMSISQRFLLRINEMPLDAASTALEKWSRSGRELCRYDLNTRPYDRSRTRPRSISGSSVFDIWDFSRCVLWT